MSAHRHQFTTKEDERISDEYPDVPTKVLAKELGLSYRSLQGRANELGVKKSKHYQRWVHGGRAGKGEHRSPATEFKRKEQ